MPDSRRTAVRVASIRVVVLPPSDINVSASQPEPAGDLFQENHVPRILLHGRSERQPTEHHARSGRGSRVGERSGLVGDGNGRSTSAHGSSNKKERRCTEAHGKHSHAKRPSASCSDRRSPGHSFLRATLAAPSQTTRCLRHLSALRNPSQAASCAPPPARREIHSILSSGRAHSLQILALSLFATDSSEPR